MIWLTNLELKISCDGVYCSSWRPEWRSFPAECCSEIVGSTAEDSLLSSFLRSVSYHQLLPQITPCLLYMLLHFCDFQYFQLVTGNWIAEDRDFNAHKVTLFVNGNSSFMIQDHLSLVWFIVEKFQLSYPVSILVEGVQVIENGGLLLVLQQRPKMGNERLWKLAVNKMVRTFYLILIFFLCCLLRSDAWCWWMK